MIIVLCAALAFPAQAAKRLALVIGNDIYKNGGDELIVDLLKIFYEEVLNAPSSNYTQKKRDQSHFPRAKRDPFDVF